MEYILNYETGRATLLKELVNYIFFSLKALSIINFPLILIIYFCWSIFISLKRDSNSLSIAFIGLSIGRPICTAPIPVFSIINNLFNLSSSSLVMLLRLSSAIIASYCVRLGTARPDKKCETNGDVLPIAVATSIFLIPYKRRMDFKYPPNSHSNLQFNFTNKPHI